MAGTMGCDSRTSMDQTELNHHEININHIMKKAVCKLLAGKNIDKEE